MDIRELTYFLEIAKTENITKAAENLHMSQPPLSRSMQLLEEELGVTLFVRGKRKTTLTQEGIYLREQAQQMVELATKTREQIQEVKNVLNGTLYIGSVESLAAGVIPKWIKIFHDDYPMVHFNWWSGNSDDVLNRLEKGLIDVAIVRAPCNYEKFNCFLVGKEPWSAFINGSNPLAHEAGDTIALQKLEGEDLIIPARKNREKEITGWFHELSLEPKISCAISPVLNAVALVEYNMGIAILPDSAKDYVAGKNIISKKLTSPVKESEILIVWNKYSMLPETADKFIRFIRGEVEELNEGN